MKFLTLVLFLTFYSVANAGPGHSHGHKHGDGQKHTHDAAAIDEKAAQANGVTEIQRLIKNGKLDATWSAATFDKAEKKQFGKKTEWVVTYNNEKGVEGKKLYVFLKTNGEFVAANFTGK